MLGARKSLVLPFLAQAVYFFWRKLSVEKKNFKMYDI